MKDTLIISLNGCESLLLNSFNIVVGMLLGPIALFSFMQLIKDYMSAGVVGPGWYPGIVRNTGIHGNDRKFHRKIWCHKTVRIQFLVDSRLSNKLCGKNRKPANAGNQQTAF